MDAKRGYVPEDDRNFSPDSIKTMRVASRHIAYLINEGYDLKQASTFVGNHFLLSERQRLALARSIAPDDKVVARRSREIDLASIETNGDKLALPEINVDGFNTVITLETALSGSPVFKGMDGCIRDLAGLRGTYRIIDVTKKAVDLLLLAADNLHAGRVNVFLDAPVSNSGRLKTLFYERQETLGCGFSLEISVISDVDAVLKQSGYAVSSDSVILDYCRSWINLVLELLKKCGGVWMIDLDLIGAEERKA